MSKYVLYAGAVVMVLLGLIANFLDVNSGKEYVAVGTALMWIAASVK